VHDCQFQPGDQVIVLLPTSNNKLQLQTVYATNNVNMLREWHSPTAFPAGLRGRRHTHALITTTSLQNSPTLVGRTEALCDSDRPSVGTMARSAEGNQLSFHPLEPISPALQLHC
jgi:hypothetical protein